MVLKTSCWADFVHFQNSNRLQKITRLSSKRCRLLTSPNKTNNEDSSSQYSDSFIVTCEVTFNAAEKIKNNSLVAQKTSKWEKTWRPKDGDDWNGLKMSAKFWLTRFAYLCLDCQITQLFFTFFFFLQLAVDSVDVIVHGNSDCDSAQHSHCPDEYDLHTGQESRSSGVWCGSYFTAHSHGEISFSGK